MRTAILCAITALLFTWMTGRPVAAADDPPFPEGQALRVVLMPNTPLFSQRQPDGEIVGFNADIAREVCRLLNAVCTFSTTAFDTIVDQVAAGKYELGMGNLLRTPEREKRLLYSEPYWRSTSSMIGRRGTPELSLADAVRTKPIAVTRGSRQLDAAVRLGAGAAGTLVPVDGSVELWQALRGGRAEIVLTPTLQAIGFLLSPEGEEFTTIGLPLSTEGLGGPVHIVFPLGRADLKAAVDGAIRHMRTDGTYQALSRRYFSFDIY